MRFTNLVAGGVDVAVDGDPGPAEIGLRFVDPAVEEPRVSVSGDKYGTVSITTVPSNIPLPSDDLLKLQSVPNNTSATATEYMKFTKSGIVKKDGTAKQLYTEAGGTATIGTTSDTTSYTAVAPLNSSNVVPASYMGLQMTVWSGYLSSAYSFFTVSILHTKNVTINSEATLLTYLKTVMDNRSGTSFSLPAAGPAVSSANNYIITRLYVTGNSSSISARLSISGLGTGSITAAYVISSNTFKTNSSESSFYTYDII